MKPHQVLTMHEYSPLSEEDKRKVKNMDGKVSDRTIKDMKIGPNCLCGCGSGKKYKRCCMRFGYTWM